MILTAISGELVPKATTVKPTTRGVMPTVTAILDAPRTRISAPPVNNMRPMMNNMIEVVLMIALRSFLLNYPGIRPSRKQNHDFHPTGLCRMTLRQNTLKYGNNDIVILEMYTD
jgi:hypothetical protein